MQHGAGEVEHPAYMAAVLNLKSFAYPPRQHFRADLNRLDQSLLYSFAQLIEQLSQRRQKRIAPVALGQRLARRVPQQTVDGRQTQVRAGTAGRHLALLNSKDRRARV
ncbi:hypothetical protein D3C87_1413590 [compost metagenome]